MTIKNNAIRTGKRSLLRIIFSRTMLITLLLLLNFMYVFSILSDLFQIVPLLVGSMIAFTAVIELVILNSEDNVDVKLTWAVVVAVLPLLGAVLYGFIRFDLGNRVNRKLINTSIISSQPFIPENPSLYEAVK